MTPDLVNNSLKNNKNPNLCWLIRSSPAKRLYNCSRLCKKYDCPELSPPKKNLTGNFWEPEMSLDSLDVFSTYKYNVGKTILNHPPNHHK
jgi:hypothetical protein